MQILYACLREDIQKHALDADELEERLAKLLEKSHDSLSQRLAALLLDDGSGLKELLKEANSRNNELLQRLSDMLARSHRELALELSKQFFSPRLTLPLRAYSIDGAASRRLYYGGRRVSLVGRESQLQCLHEFLHPKADAEHDLSWWLWTGPAGIGKSRLGLELCLQAIQLGYQAGFWERTDKFDSWDKWTVDQPTLVVIDYVSERAAAVREGILQLFRYPVNIRRHLRLLLLERSADEQLDLWYREFHSARSVGDRNDLNDCQYAEPLSCLGLKNAAICSIFEEVFLEYGFQQPASGILPLYRDIDDVGRPLLAAVAAEAIAHGGDAAHIRNWSASDLVETVVRREVDSWRDAEINDAHVNLLAYATMRRGCESSESDALSSEGMNVPTTGQLNERWFHQMTSFAPQNAVTELSPLVPDMLGEWLVLERLAGRHDMNAPNRSVVGDQTKGLLTAAWRKDPLTTAMFSLRALEDFPLHDGVSALLSDELAIDPFWYSMLVCDAVPELVKAGRNELGQILIHRVSSFPPSPHRDWMLAQALVNRGVTYGQMGDNQRAIDDFTAAIELPHAPAEQVAEALDNRGVTYGQMGDNQRAIDDFTAAIELPHAPAEHVAKALVNRGITYGQMGDNQRAIDDYTAAIELPHAPAEHVAKALYNRGITYGQMGDNQRAIDDFTAAIELPHAPAEHVAKALYNRGFRYGQMGDNQREIDDYTAAIELPHAPAEQVAKALVNRGFTYGQMGDNQRAIDDYTAAIELPHAPAEQVAKALVNRGVTYGQMGDNQREIDDYTAAIELPHAPAEQVAEALYNRGVRYGQMGDNQREIDDYTAAIELPHAPAEHVAKALYNRGFTYGQMGDNQREIDDYTAAIELPHAPAEQVAKALVNRGVTYGQMGDNQREIDDYTAAIELPHAPAEQVAEALVNRGVRYGQMGDNQREIDDYTAVIELPHAPAEQVAKALFNRGVTYGQMGDNQREIDDYTAAIELPHAPAEQVAKALVNRGVRYGQMGDNQRAIDDYTAAIELPHASRGTRGKSPAGIGS